MIDRTELAERRPPDKVELGNSKVIVLSSLGSTAVSLSDTHDAHKTSSEPSEASAPRESPSAGSEVADNGRNKSNIPKKLIEPFNDADEGRRKFTIEEVSESFSQKSRIRDFDFVRAYAHLCVCDAAEVST